MEPRPKFFHDFSRACMHVRAMQGPSGDGYEDDVDGGVRVSSPNCDSAY